MTSQPPQDEVEEVARAICGPNCDAPTCSCQPTELAKQICWQTELDRAHVAIATIDRLRRATPAEGKDNSVAAGAAPLLDNLRLSPAWRWHVEYDNGYVVLDQEGDLVAIGMATVEQTNAIAAAPDMLLALKAMAEEWVNYMTINNLGDPWAKHNMRLAAHAIKKAEGRDEAAEPLRSESKAGEPVPLPAPPKDETHG